MALKLNKILLVEDNPNDVELTVEALMSYKLVNVITVVSDGEEALDYLNCKGKYTDRSPGNPMLIILDIKLPKIDGLEVLRRIRTDEKLRFIPVVVFSSSREEPDLAESYRLGVNAYVVKPVDFPEFNEAVKRLGLFWTISNEPPPGESGI
jgi:CheY-like chemotaxis protein